MKKLTLFVAILSVLSLASCKKAYDCTCKTTETSDTYTSEMTQFNTYVENQNKNVEDDITNDNTETVISMDKTSKANANAGCTSTVTTDVNEYADGGDADGDDDENEIAYTRTTVYTTDCELAKK